MLTNHCLHETKKAAKRIEKYNFFSGHLLKSLRVSLLFCNFRVVSVWISPTGANMRLTESEALGRRLYFYSGKLPDGITEKYQTEASNSDSLNKGQKKAAFIKLRLQPSKNLRDGEKHLVLFFGFLLIFSFSVRHRPPEP